MIQPKKYHSGKVEVFGGDCREVLRQLPENYFDAACADPPYHFASIVKRFGADGAAPAKSNGATGVYKRASVGFMGKQWDGGQIAHEPETWAAVLRVLKPGAHLVAFHAPKNWHRLALAIEDAGFEIRDNLLWLFGSGFPKSHDVSKAIDRELGVEREVTGFDETKFRPNRIDRGLVNSAGGSGFHADNGATVTAPTSELARLFDGFGTALKPAYEPIILARKPLARGKTIAANVMAYGTGALNIDACRVETSDEIKPVFGGRKGEKHGGKYGNSDDYFSNVSPLGRWPANLCHDGSPEVVEGFPESDGAVSNGRKGQQGLYEDGIGSAPQAPSFGDSGSAARFFATFPQEPQSRLFYTSKADTDDRLASRHPTVKPVSLIQWLCRLITPPKGHILDCFAGTGTTAEAALREGFRCTLIEREPEYLADIDRRMALAFEGSTGRSVAMAKLRPEGEPLPLFAEAAE